MTIEILIANIPQITSWVVFIGAIAIALQNFAYIRRNCNRRQNLHFAFLILAVYMAGLYLIAALTPPIWFIRSGMATKIGIILLLWMIYSITRMDETDERREHNK